MNEDTEIAAEALALLAVHAEEAAGDVDGYARQVLERVAARISELSEALADGDVAMVERLCPATE